MNETASVCDCTKLRPWPWFEDGPDREVGAGAVVEGSALDFAEPEVTPQHGYSLFPPVGAEFYAVVPFPFRVLPASAWLLCHTRAAA